MLGKEIPVSTPQRKLWHIVIVLAVCIDRKSTRLNSSHGYISYAVFCLTKKMHNALSITRLTPASTLHGRPRYSSPTMLPATCTVTIRGLQQRSATAPYHT